VALFRIPDSMHRVTATPSSIQLRFRHRIYRCRDQEVFRRNRPAISGTRQLMQHEADAEPAAAFPTRAADLEGLAGNAHCTANLRAPGTGEVEDATEPGPKAERCCYGTHNTELVSQRLGSGAIGDNRPARPSTPLQPRVRGARTKLVGPLGFCPSQ
jgi:hypothetical protein